MPNPSLLMTEDAEHQRRAGAISDVPVDVDHTDLARIREGRERDRNGYKPHILAADCFADLPGFSAERVLRRAAAEPGVTAGCGAALVAASCLTWRSV